MSANPAKGLPARSRDDACIDCRSTPCTSELRMARWRIVPAASVAPTTLILRGVAVPAAAAANRPAAQAYAAARNTGIRIASETDSGTGTSGVPVGCDGRLLGADLGLSIAR